MRIIESVVIGGCKTEIPCIHVIGRLIVDTAIRKNGDWQSENVVWVSIEEWVGITNSRRSHGTISLSLVRLIQNLVVLSGLIKFISTQHRDFHLTDRLEL